MTPKIKTSKKPHLYSLEDLENYQGISNIIGLPQSEIDQRFLNVQNAVETRWQKLMTQLSFPKYRMHQDENTLASEFQQLNKLRTQLYFDLEQIPYQSQPDFKIAQHILLSHNYRQPSTISFEHSKADDSYNCSCIMIGRRKFFALDGPTAETIQNFYRLLANWNINDLVCLVGENEGGIPKCFPYWNSQVYEEQGESIFCLPLEGLYETPLSSWDQKKVQYTSISNWKDHCALDVDLFLNEAHKARVKNKPGHILAVHCSGGVGRTGTFIALICLLDYIDKQVQLGVTPSNIQLNISELFLKLSFYRPWAISKESQYISLYRAVDAYLAKNCHHQELIE